ncbi:MAG: hypothetical protein KME17_22640 [Cyanosarcina radialis HA8281-LM2]|nr:hypothetical protein [Cyanosarcina radialis HA8281-LM2]
MKPDFEQMSKAELRAYIVSHPNEKEAFEKFVDRFKANPEDRGWHPYPQTPEDLAKVQQLIQQRIEQSHSN